MWEYVFDYGCGVDMELILHFDSDKKAADFAFEHKVVAYRIADDELVNVSKSYEDYLIDKFSDDETIGYADRQLFEYD